MNKLKLFLSNFIIYGLGGTVSKIIPLIMLPIITRIIPTTEYFGLSDMSTTIVSLCSALAIMGMYDAMFRMFFEKGDESYQKDICSTAFLFTFFTSILIFAIMLILKNFLAEQFFNNAEYSYVIYITAMATLVGATNSILSAPTRMQNKRGIYLVTNILSPLLSYSVAIPLLLNGYYVIALPLSGLISVAVMEVVFLILNRKWFSFKRFHFVYLKQLMKIALPLLPNFIIYWVFDSCDKLMITNMLGLDYEGVYSVGSKLGHVSQLIYTAFSGGWQFFAFSVMREENQVETNTKIFEYLGAISFICSMLVFALSSPIFKLLFDDQYYSGYIVAPYLFLSPLLLMLFQVACNQFLVIKKTWPNMLILSLGMVVNIVLNLLLIPIMGIEGASIATLTGYVISVVLVVLILWRMKLMKISLRLTLIFFIMIGYVVLWRFLIMDILWLSVLVAVACGIVIVFLYRKDIKKLFKKHSATE